MEKEKKERQETLTPLQKKGFAFVYEMQRQNEELAAQVADLQQQVRALSKFAEQTVLLMPPVLALLDEPQRREAIIALFEQAFDLNRQNGDFFDTEEAWAEFTAAVKRIYPEVDIDTP